MNAEYTVRLWTDFKWENPKGRTKAITAEKTRLRSNRMERLTHASVLMNRKALAFNQPTRVTVVDVKRQPQLCFEIVVLATDADDALTRARYRTKRLLAVKLGANNNPPSRPIFRSKPVALPAQQRTLTPPWGRHEVAVNT